MKLFIIGSLLFSGGSAAAMQNETVNEEVTNIYNQVKTRVQKRFKKELYNEVKETGFPYPSEEFLSTLTEDQALAIVTEIDMINATYNWSTMTDTEIKDALLLVKDQMIELYDELGIEVPLKNQGRDFMIQERIEDIKTNGLSYPHSERLESLTEEQALAITAKIDEFNELYDWATMTDEEILDALKLVKDEMSLLRDELGIEAPIHNYQRRIRKAYREGFKNGFRHGRNSQTEEDDVVEGDDSL